jgi:hypothetical protein
MTGFENRPRLSSSRKLWVLHNRCFLPQLTASASCWFNNAKDRFYFSRRTGFFMGATLSG